MKKVVPLVICVDMYRQLSDTDHLDLMAVLGCDCFDVRGIVLDQMRRTKNVTYDGVDYIRFFLKMAGREDIPVYPGVKEPMRSRTDFDRDDEPGISFLRQTMADTPGLTILNWASLADTVIAWHGADEAARQNVESICASLGWFDNRHYTDGAPARLQDDCNVDYDPIAFTEALTCGMPLLWYPVGYAAWLFEGQQYLAGRPEPMARWLSRELYHYHLCREYAYRPKGGSLYAYATMQPDCVIEPQVIEDAGADLMQIDREDIASRPIRMWETGGFYYLACQARNEPAPGVEVNRYRVTYSWQGKHPHLNEITESPDGIPVIRNGDMQSLRTFLLDCLGRFFRTL